MSTFDSDQAFLESLVNDKTTKNQQFEQFSVEVKYVKGFESIGFGKGCQFKIDKSQGHILTDIVLELTLPEINSYNGQSQKRWNDYIGYGMIEYAEVEIGGQRIERIPGSVMFAWQQLNHSDKTALNKMIGHTQDLCFFTESHLVNGKKYLPETTLYIPLKFFFCRHTSMAIPIELLKEHDIKIAIYFKPLEQCLLSFDGASTSELNINFVACSIYANYSILSDENLTKLKDRESLKLNVELFETLTYDILSETNNCNIANQLGFADYKYCKELIWFTEQFPDQFGNFSDTRDIMPRYASAFKSQDLIKPAPVINCSEIVDNLLSESDAIKQILQIETLKQLVSPQLNTSDMIAHLLSEQSLQTQFAKKLQNPTVTAKLCDNDCVYCEERQGMYFDTYLPNKHHTSSFSGVNCIPFCQYPEQSGGSYMKLSAKNTKFLHIPTYNCVKSKNAKIKLTTLSFYTMQIMSGMFGIWWEKP